MVDMNRRVWGYTGGNCTLEETISAEFIIQTSLCPTCNSLAAAGHTLDHLDAGEGGLAFVRGDILNF